MLKRNGKKRMVSVLLVLAMVFACASSALAAGADAVQAAAMEARYNALPDDAIVCYLFGEPVYKYEVDENRIIHKDFSGQTPQTYASGSIETGSIAGTVHANEVIYAGLQQLFVGYSESSSLMYLHADQAAIVADGVREQAEAEDLIAEIIGSVSGLPAFLVPVQALIQWTLKLGADARNEIADLLEEQGDARFTQTNSQYGSFYSVMEWDGRTVYKPCEYTTSTGTIRVLSVYCPSHSSVW